MPSSLLIMMPTSFKISQMIVIMGVFMVYFNVRQYAVMTLDKNAPASDIHNQSDTQ